MSPIDVMIIVVYMAAMNYLGYKRIIRTRMIISLRAEKCIGGR